MFVPKKLEIFEGPLVQSCALLRLEHSVRVAAARQIVQAPDFLREGMDPVAQKLAQAVFGVVLPPMLCPGHAHLCSFLVGETLGRAQWIDVLIHSLLDVGTSERRKGRDEYTFSVRWLATKVINSNDDPRQQEFSGKRFSLEQDVGAVVSYRPLVATGSKGTITPITSPVAL